MQPRKKEKDTFSTYHPVVNFVYFTAVLCITMFSMHPVFLAMTFASSFVYSCMLDGTAAVKRNLMFLVPIILMAMILNPLFTQRGETILFYLSNAAVTLEAVVYGGAAAVMFTSVIIWFFCFGRIMSTDKFIYLFGKVLPSISLVLSMCFRFVPLLQKRFQEIARGQRYLGRIFPRSSIGKKVKLMGKELSILVAWSLEMAIETSDSMEARGYGLKGRSSYSIFRLDKRDKKMLLFLSFLLVVVIRGCCLGENKILYYPRIIMGQLSVSLVITVTAYLVLLLLPILVEIQGDLTWKQLHLEM